MRQGGRRKAATVADVAVRAGVSPGTVSKALNGRGQLRPETRQRVLAAAEELGFSTNLLARSLLEGRTYTVGVLTSDSFGRFTIPVMLGVEDTLGAGQISVLLCDGRDDRIREGHYLHTLLARRVDGIIVTGRGSDPRPSLGQDLPIPVIYVLAQSEDPRDRSLIHADREGAERAVKHLFSTGRRRIAHVTGPQHHLATQRRIEGATAAFSAVGQEMVLGEPLMGEWSERWGREAASILVRSGKPFDGVFCGSDQIARGLLDGLRESGHKVPDEVGVVGFDNWEVMAEAARPPLTTIDLNLHELGRVAATELLDAMNGKALESGVRSVPCRLVVRESSESRGWFPPAPAAAATPVAPAERPEMLPGHETEPLP
ncbi:LacI family DNA-binding transcriptional regulator [Amycolatopsis jejuensis]|uniref:LacI family DNA-binding transcriptional regulator n=1 Tax=Amycolatopsis jejuensis TaxID=330084 RepID=UPI0007C4CF1D|nr:LacI family DNA-binding transcriptional regulator [Amycolatopsis jejuensis]